MSTLLGAAPIKQKPETREAAPLAPESTRQKSCPKCGNSVGNAKMGNCPRDGCNYVFRKNRSRSGVSLPGAAVQELGSLKAVEDPCSSMIKGLEQLHRDKRRRLKQAARSEQASQTSAAPAAVYNMLRSPPLLLCDSAIKQQPQTLGR